MKKKHSIQGENTCYDKSFMSREVGQNANKKVKIAAAAIAVVLVKRIMKNVEKNG